MELSNTNYIVSLRVQTENILKGQTEIGGVVLEWIIDTRHGNVTFPTTRNKKDSNLYISIYIMEGDKKTRKVSEVAEFGRI